MKCKYDVNYEKINKSKVIQLQTKYSFDEIVN